MITALDLLRLVLTRSTRKLDYTAIFVCLLILRALLLLLFIVI